MLFFFYASEHEPIHVHVRKGDEESVFEIILYQGEVQEIRLRKVKGRNHLETKDKKVAKAFVEKYAKEIVAKWIDFFVYRKVVKCEKINKKI